MSGNRCEERICEKNQELIVTNPLHCSINGLEADHIYSIMALVRNGLCMTANPIYFTNKLIPPHEPLIKLRQNDSTDVEVTCPLPIQKRNVLNPSTCDELRTIVTTYFSKLPRCDLAFSSGVIAKRVEEKEYIGKEEGVKDIDTESKEGNGCFTKDDFVYNITASSFLPENNFAVSPMQVGKWFPGMYTIYPDTMF